MAAEQARVFTSNFPETLDGVRAVRNAVAHRQLKPGLLMTTRQIGPGKSDQLEVLAVNGLDEPIDASPAIVGKQLFLRGDKHLYCIAVE
ncbi:MAG: hypothetical protein IH831_00575 [Planctomycetes bacterium]|nr:hypothetical protein [Planctomycetota bacterium]